MKMTTVYLAGAIDGQPADQVTCWRRKAVQVLKENGFSVIDPTEGKDMTAFYDPRDIVETDLENVDRADILLVEMNTPGHAYIGTAIEIRRAWEQGKPIICWGTVNRASYFLLYHTSAIYDTLDEALGVIVNGNYPRDIRCEECEKK
jgi:nucleoside 2-deoxyribosyltransferase